MADDFSADTSTTGAVAVGATADGNIETVGDKVTDNTPDHCLNG